MDLLKQSLLAVGIAEAVVTRSKYMVIHDAVEKEHQESRQEAMEIILAHGCKLTAIQHGGEVAIRFLIDMVQGH